MTSETWVRLDPFYTGKRANQTHGRLGIVSSLLQGGAFLHGYSRVSILLFIFILTATITGTAFSGPPAAGGILPELYLPVPGEIQYRQYLGLDDKPEFKISEIKADVIIIQIFSMY